MNPNLPSVAVITPYHGEDLSVLAACHSSVRHQTFPCLHVLVADGLPQPILDTWEAHHVVLPVSHHDIGSTPRLLGSFHAIGLGLDAVAFLDADNWYDPEHIEGLMSARREQGAAYVSSGRMLWSLDGVPMGPCPLIDPARFIDTNCMLFGREAFHLLHNWVLMPDYCHLIGDRIVHNLLLQSGLPLAHVDAQTVNYRCNKEGLYKQLGQPVPAGVLPRPDYEASLARWVADGHPPLL
jgi:glycosyltransferase involved in cell wall biosynthesis